jgi:hypothetical protein
MKRFLIVIMIGLVSVFLVTTAFAQTTTEKATKAATDAAEKAKEAAGVTTQEKATTPAKTEKSGAKEQSGSCQKITQICKNADFDPGEGKKGTGLNRDCINPIMQGKTKVPGAKKPLPAVDPKLVAACKAENPKFGQGPVGSK